MGETINFSLQRHRRYYLCFETQIAEKREILSYPWIILSYLPNLWNRRDITNSFESRNLRGTFQRIANPGHS